MWPAYCQFAEYNSESMDHLPHNLKNHPKREEK